MRQWHIVFGVLIGLYMVWTPPSWAQGVFGSTQAPGDEGTEACREVQLAVQGEVGEETNPPYRNHGKYVSAAAHAANPALQAGEITEACHSCIVSQFARSIPVANQEECGPDLCVDESVESGTCTDGIDNDCDGLTDSADPACVSDGGSCTVPTTDNCCGQACCLLGQPVGVCFSPFSGGTCP